MAPLQGAGQSTISLTMQANSSLHSSYSSVVLAGDAVGESLYTGCIDRVIVNGEMLPLLTPNIATVPTMSCGPRYLANALCCFINIIIGQLLKYLGY